MSSQRLTGVRAKAAGCLSLLVLAAGVGVVRAPAASAALAPVTFSQSSIPASTQPGPYCTNTFPGPTFCGTPEVVGDFNSDGRPDLAVANYSANTVSVLPGTAAGNFGAPATYAVGIGPDALAVGDFNGDGRLDLAVANFQNRFDGGQVATVSVLLSTTTGSFDPQIVTPITWKPPAGQANQTTQVNNPTGLVAGDFNGDGRLDVVVSGFYGAAWLLAGVGDGSFAAPMTNGPTSYNFWTSVAAGDFNGDGRLDLAVTSEKEPQAGTGPNAVSVLLGDGKGGFGAPTTYNVADYPEAVAVGDLNGDGRLDLAVVSFGPYNGTSEVDVLAGAGNGTFTLSKVYDTSKWDLTAVVVADVNGDGRADLAFAGQNTGLTVVLSDGTRSNFPAATGYGLAVGELNGDGRPDVFIAGKGSVTLMVGTSGPGRLAAVDDSYVAAQETPLSVSQPGVLGNDTEPNRKPLTASLVGAPAHGAVTLNPDGSFTYKPAAGYYGADAFTYTVSNGTAKSPPGAVSLTVRRRPNAANDSYFANQDSTLKVDAAGGLLANDTNFSGFPRLTAKVVGAPAHGAVSINPDGSFAYTPATGYYGPDAFTYTASDNVATSNLASVAMTVRPLPVAVNDQYTVVVNSVGLFNVPTPGLLGNDLRLIPGYTKVTLASPASHGRVVLTQGTNNQCPSNTGCGQFTYQVAKGFHGQDSFTYRVTDVAGASNVATVTLNVP